MAFFITTAFVVIGVAACHLRRERHVEESIIMQKMGLGLLIVLVPLQVVVGDLHGINTLEHQPAKIAAIEANWERRHACRCCFLHGPMKPPSVTAGNSPFRH